VAAAAVEHNKESQLLAADWADVMFIVTHSRTSLNLTVLCWS